MAILLRKRSRSRRKLSAIGLPYASSVSAGIASNGPGESSFSLGISGKFSLTAAAVRFCAELLRFFTRLQVRNGLHLPYGPFVTAEVSNSDQLFVPDGAIMNDRGEHFFYLFQVI
jgi:hypothetical protein